jgi:hypothetical protein
MNLVLVRSGYPPVIIFKRQRGAYLAAMQRADGGDYGALGELIARAWSYSPRPRPGGATASPIPVTSPGWHPA